LGRHSFIGAHNETHRQGWAFRIILQIRELEGMHWRWGKGRASQGMVPRSAQFRARRDGRREKWGDKERKRPTRESMEKKWLGDKTAPESDSVRPLCMVHTRTLSYTRRNMSDSSRILYEDMHRDTTVPC
jgi:hypothetical protein